MKKIREYMRTKTEFNLEQVQGYYVNQMVKEQKVYLKFLKKNIKNRAKNGYTHYDTLYEGQKDWVTDEFLDYIKKEYVNLGFKVETKIPYYSNPYHLLRISWTGVEPNGNNN